VRLGRYLIKGGLSGSALYFSLAMIELDDSELTPEYKAFLQEWAEALNVSLEVLLGRIVVATIDGFLYIEKIPDYYP